MIATAGTGAGGGFEGPVADTANAVPALFLGGDDDGGGLERWVLGGGRDEGANADDDGAALDGALDGSDGAKAFPGTTLRAGGARKTSWSEIGRASCRERVS